MGFPENSTSFFEQIQTQLVPPTSLSPDVRDAIQVALDRVSASAREMNLKVTGLPKTSFNLPPLLPETTLNPQD